MAKIRVRSKFVTNSKPVSYKVVQEKVLNWTSKGRQLDLKRASIASQLGVFSKPRDHVLVLSCMKIVYKHRVVWEQVVCRRRKDMVSVCPFLYFYLVLYPFL